MIDHEKRLLFIHIARTGGTSIEHALVGNDWWEIDPSSKHLSASQTRKFYGEAIWNSYTKFTVVRNPWDRIVSMWATNWWANNSEDLSLYESTHEKLRHFVLQLKPHPYEKYGSLFYYEILDEIIDFTLRFESLTTDFSTMLTKLDLPNTILPHCEKRDRKNYSEYYDNDTEKLVGSIFQRDIELFQYKF